MTIRQSTTNPHERTIIAKKRQSSDTTTVNFQAVYLSVDDKMQHPPQNKDFPISRNTNKQHMTIITKKMTIHKEEDKIFQNVKR